MKNFATVVALFCLGVVAMSCELVAVSYEQTMDGWLHKYLIFVQTENEWGSAKVNDDETKHSERNRYWQCR